jgi:hypothetical protein
MGGALNVATRVHAAVTLRNLTAATTENEVKVVQEGILRTLIPLLSTQVLA